MSTPREREEARRKAEREFLEREGKRIAEKGERIQEDMRRMAEMTEGEYLWRQLLLRGGRFFP